MENLELERLRYFRLEVPLCNEVRQLTHFKEE